MAAEAVHPTEFEGRRGRRRTCSFPGVGFDGRQRFDGGEDRRHLRKVLPRVEGPS